MVKMKKADDSINLYKILEELKEIENNLHSFKNSEELSMKIIKAKSYIYSKEILKNEYNKLAQKFYKNFNTSDYIEEAYRSREQVKKITTSLMQNEGEITYTEHINFISNIKDIRTTFSNNKNIEYKLTSDDTKLYYYPSLMLLNSKFLSVFSAKDVAQLKESISLEHFYNIMLQKYGYTAESIKVPKYIEFYLSTTEIDFFKALGEPDFFNVLYYLVCLNSVLSHLHIFIKGKIYDEYHKNMLTSQSNKKELKNNLLKIGITNNDIVISEKNIKITLTPQLKHVFESILYNRNINDKNLICNICRINAFFKKLNLPPIIVKKYRKGPYVFNADVYDIK